MNNAPNELMPFQVENGDGKATSAQLTIHHWTPTEGRLKGFMVGGGIAFAGLLTIFIPIVHFVSVPAALIAAPIAYKVVSGLFSSGMTFKGQSTCPACRASIPVQGSADKWPKYVNCPECRVALKLSPDAAV